MADTQSIFLPAASHLLESGRDIMPWRFASRPAPLAPRIEIRTEPVRATATGEFQPVALAEKNFPVYQAAVY